MKNKALGKLLNIDELINTVKRFPFSCLCILSAFVISTGLLYDHINHLGFVASTMLPLSILGFFWFGGMALYREAYAPPVYKYSLVSALGLVLLYIISFGLGDLGAGVRVLSVFVSLIVFVGYAPYIHNRYSDNDFWVYNRQLWFGVLFSCLAALLFYAGVCLAITSIKYLFDIDFGHKIYGLMAIVCFNVLAPLYSLSFVPKRFDEGNEDCRSPKPMTFFINWLLIPLILFYILTLYAYFLKAGLGGEILKNQVIYMIAGFAGLGVCGYLVSWPLHTNSGRLTRFFSRILFPVLIIPTAVMVYSIVCRISEYGVTENRYIIALAGLWLSCIIVLKLFGRLRLWYIVALLSILFFMSSWGPWSAYNVSMASQEYRLERVLSKNGLLDGNRLVAAQTPDDISLEDKIKISDIYDYVSRKKSVREVNNVYGYSNRNDFFKAINLDYINAYQVSQSDQSPQMRYYYRYNSQRYDRVFVVSGYDYYVNAVRIAENRDFKTSNPTLTFTIEDNVIKISADKGMGMNIDLNDMMSEIKTRSIQRGDERGDPENDLILSTENQFYVIKLYVSNVSGYEDRETTHIENISASMLVKVK